jgi:hypothetical protein
MLIRSQDKRILINMDNVSSLEVGDDGLRLFADDGETIYDIGEYLTESKVIKVLDMIQEAYCEFMAVRNDDMWCGKESVFQMPEDSEVVV